MIAAIHGILEQGPSLDPDTIIQRDRILADGGTIGNLLYMDRFIRKCKELGIWTTLTSAPDINFGHKKVASDTIQKAYCLKGLDYVTPGTAYPGIFPNSAGNKSLSRALGGTATLQSATNINISGNAVRHIITIFNQSTSVAAGVHQTVAGWGGAGTGLGFDISLYNDLTIFHGQGSGMDTTTAAPAYTKGVNNIFELGYDDDTIKSSINGGARFSKVQADLNTTNSIIKFSGGAYASWAGFQGYGIPPFVWSVAIPATPLAQLLTFLKTEYSIA